MTAQQVARSCEMSVPREWLHVHSPSCRDCPQYPSIELGLWPGTGVVRFHHVHDPLRADGTHELQTAQVLHELALSFRQGPGYNLSRGRQWSRGCVTADMLDGACISIRGTGENTTHEGLGPLFQLGVPGPPPKSCGEHQALCRTSAASAVVVHVPPSLKGARVQWRGVAKHAGNRCKVGE